MKAVTIAQAEQSKGSSVWAINNTAAIDQRQGVINVSVVEGTGRTSVVKLPITFIPVDLTMQATKRAILESPDFRRLVGGGFIKLISEQDAEKALESEEAKKEQRRLFNLITDELSPIQESAPKEVKDILAASADEISGFALNFAHTEDGNEDDMVTTLRNQGASLTTTELQYIVNNSKFARVKALAAEMIIK